MKVSETYQCDVCKAEIDRNPPARVHINHDARKTGGALLFTGQDPIMWPLESTNPDLCADCAQVALTALEERIKEQ